MDPAWFLSVVQAAADGAEMVTLGLLIPKEHHLNVTAYLSAVAHLWPSFKYLKTIHLFLGNLKLPQFIGWPDPSKLNVVEHWTHS